MTDKQYQQVADKVNKDFNLPKSDQAVDIELVKQIDDGQGNLNHPVHQAIETYLRDYPQSLTWDRHL